MRLLHLTAIGVAAIAVVWIRASTLPGEMVTIASVTDGDTVRVITEEGQELRVRLACIDAPESKAKHGDAATSRLLQLTPEGMRVRFKDLGSGGFGRRAGELYTGTWPIYKNANRTLVTEGKAIVYPEYVRKCDAASYWWDEKWARIFRRGVHADPYFCKPWLYRAGACSTRTTQGFLYWLESLWMNPWAQ
jgi:micrococcal nuclease